MGRVGDTQPTSSRLRPYVSGLALQWLETTPYAKHRLMDGSLAFVDISGFTALTERLAARGKVGAEEMSDLLNLAFAELLAEAYQYGASLVKWGGDAVLLLFEGEDHPALAARAAYEMRRTMRRIGRLRTSVGTVQLRMSVGIHSGTFDFFMAGSRHHELLVAGPGATITTRMEQTAEAGEIVVSVATAALLPPAACGESKGDGVLLRSPPRPAPRSRCWPVASTPADPGSCLDPAIRDHLLHEVGDSEHRQIAVAFLEVSGVDDLIATRGADAVGSELHALMSVVQDACEHHAVTFWETDISADGFKVMLVAGAPRSSGRDEEGMVRACRTILDRYDGPLRLRIGANCGRVFNGGFGPAFRRTWSVKGDAINLAARVMGKAAAGGLLATDSLLERVKVEVVVDPLPPFTVKGKQLPVRASRVTGVLAHGASLGRRETPFVGRDHELALLLAAAGEATEGNGVAVVVVGEPGIGKSRLVDSICERLASELTVVRGFGDSYQSSTPYFVIRRLLRAVLGVAHDAPGRVVVRELRRRVAEVAPELTELLPLLASPLGVEIPDTTQTAAVHEEFRRARTVSVAMDLLQRLAVRPTAFVVDDVQHADDASAEILGRMASAASSRPWLVVLAGRDLPVADDQRELSLGPLTPAAAQELAFVVAGDAQLSPHVLREVLARAEGNPLFLRELAAAAAVASDTDELPSSVEELLAAQIDDLAPNERSLLRTVAVLGNRFDASLAGELVGAELDRDDDWAPLDRFLARHEDGTLRFRTSLARDAAYESLPFRRRVELHSRAATALESRSALDGEDRSDALSLHCLNAQRYAEAWRYARAAAVRAQRAFANVEALALLRRARQAARRLPGVDGAELAELLESIGDVCARLADLDAATAAYREARRLAPATAAQIRARVALSAGIAATRGGRAARAARWFAVAEKEVQGHPELLVLRGRILVDRAMMRHLEGRHQEAAELCNRAIAVGEAAGSELVVARALTILDANDLAVGAMPNDERLTRALTLVQHIGDLPREAAVWNQLGMHAYFAGDWDVAVERYSQAREIHERIGDDWNAATNSFNIAEILVDQGRLEQAEPLAVEALRVWRAAKTPLDVGYGAALLGRIHARTGRYPSALALLQEAMEAFRVNNERFDLIDAELRIVEALVLQGASRDALARLAHADKATRAVLRASGAIRSADDGLPPTLPQSVQLARLSAYALAQSGEPEAARSCLLAALERLDRQRSPHDTAVLLDALLWLTPNPALARERDGLFTRLGIVWRPEVPRHGDTSTAVGSLVPPQRTAPSTDAVAPVTRR